MHPVFFLMDRRPPRPPRTDTRFPHTTLCRSAAFVFPPPDRTVVDLAPRRVEAGALNRHGVPFPARSPAKRARSEEHTSELQSLMRISYAVFCLKKKKRKKA